MSPLENTNTVFARLYDYAYLDAYCPCCAETELCEADCTFEQDAPVEWARMMRARIALGYVPKEDAE